MSLVIVESPNKIKKIKSILGEKFVVMASVGHIYDLAKKDMGIDISTWEPTYVVNPGKTDVVKQLKDEAKKHQDIYIASDADQEGTAIAFNLKELLEGKGKKVYRSIFRSMTKQDVLDGINNPIPFDENLFKAQKVRRITDRVAGFKVSPLMWSKGLKGTSAGRVQSAALKFVVDREKEIRDFVVEEYWSIAALTEPNFNAEFYGINAKKVVPKNKAEVDAILADIGKTLKVSDYKKKSRSREPFPPFETASMQKEAGTKFGWTAQRVMDTAQNLFAQGGITYHRTTSISVEASKVTDIRDRIEKAHGIKYLSPKPIFYGAGSQDAHEAIRPTFEPMPPGLGGDEKKLLELITNRFMASQMADAVFDQAAIKFEHKGKKTYEFRATGSVMQFDGFLKVYGSTGKDVSLPSVTIGQVVPITMLVPNQHFTKPPSRYTDPMFTEKMEKEGIGRPSTYAATIETLLKRNYATRDVKTIKATDVGIMVCDYLEKHFSILTSPEMTANMEKELDQIAQGNLDFVPILDKFYKEILDYIDKAKGDKGQELFKTEMDCPKCPGSKLIKRLSDYGVFFGCENHPKCGYILSYDDKGELKENTTETGVPCPTCNGILVERTGKWGKWVSCSNYPTCSWKGKLNDEGKPVATGGEKTEHKCPKCTDGVFIKRKKSGTESFFLGCSNYPKCKSTANIDDDGKVVEAVAKTTKAAKPAKSTGAKCPKCKAGEVLIRDGKFGKFKSCSEFRNGCKFTEKVK